MDHEPNDCSFKKKTAGVLVFDVLSFVYHFPSLATCVPSRIRLLGHPGTLHRVPAMLRLIFLMASCLLFNAQGYVFRILDVPNEVFADSICSNCTILDLTQLGMTCHQLSDWTKALIDILFKRKVAGSLVYDVEKLFPIYKNTDEEDKVARKALKRLIKLSIPSRPDLKYDHVYHCYRRALFKPRSEDLTRIIFTKRFPELCRMVLKHRIPNDPLGARDRDSVLKGKHIDLLLPIAPELQVPKAWRNFAYEFGPVVAYKLARYLHDNGIRHFRNFDLSFEQMAQLPDVTFDEVYLMMSMCKEDEEIEVTKRVISSFPESNLFYRTLGMLLLKGSIPICAHLISTCVYSESARRGLVLLALQSSDPTKIYMSIRGKEIVQSCFKYLDSFNWALGRFQTARPAKVSARFLLEAALFFGYESEIIEKILKGRSYNTDPAILLLALIKSTDTRIIYCLLGRINERRISFMEIAKKIHGTHLRDYRIIPINANLIFMTTQSIHKEANAEFLWSMATKETVCLDAVKNYLSGLRGSEYAIRVDQMVAGTWRSSHSKEELGKFVKFILRRKFSVQLIPRNYPESCIYELFDVDISLLLQHIPKRLPKTQLHSLFRHFSRNSSIVYAARMILSRQGGYGILRSWLCNDIDFYTLLIYAQNEDLNIHELFRALPKFPMLQDFLDFVIMQFCSFENSQLKELLELIVASDDKLLISCLLALQSQYFWSLDKSPWISSVSCTALKSIIYSNGQVCRSIATSSDLLQLCSQHGLIQNLFEQLITLGYVNSHNDISDSFPKLLEHIGTDVVAIEVEIQRVVQKNEEIEEIPLFTWSQDNGND